MYCKKCGAKIEENAKFCGECGFERNNEELNMVNTIDNRRSGTYKTIGTIMLIIMIILGIYMGYNHETSESIYDYDKTFNVITMIYYWIIGFGIYAIFHMIYSICYRLDLLIDKE